MTRTRTFQRLSPSEWRNCATGMNLIGVSAFVAHPVTGENKMLRKVMTMVLIGGGLMVAACNTVRGAGQDVQSAANCTENAIHNGNC